MSDLKALEQAFLKADEAGNTEDAQLFANELRRLSGQTVAKTEQEPIALNDTQTSTAVDSVPTNPQQGVDIPFGGDAPQPKLAHPLDIHGGTQKSSRAERWQQQNMLESLDKEGNLTPTENYGLPAPNPNRESNPASHAMEIEPALQGITLGHSDEIRGHAGAAYEKIRSIFTGEDIDYNQVKKTITDRVRERLAEMRAKNPKTVLAAEIGGGFATGMTSIAKTIPTGYKGAIATGAALGGISGAGMATEGNKTKSALIGAGVGAVAAPVLAGAGYLAGKGANKILRKKPVEMPNKQTVNQYELNSVGIKNPTKGQLTNDPIQRSKEINTAKINKEMSVAFDEQNTQLTKTLDDLAGKTGSKTTDNYQVGEAVIEGVKAGKKATHKATSKAYKETAKLLEGKTQKLSNFKKTLNDISIFKEEIPAIKTITKKIERFGDDVTAKEAEELRQIVGDSMQGIPSKFKRRIMPLMNSLEKDAQKAFGKDVFKIARSKASNEFRVFDNSKVVGAILKGKVSPDDIVKKVASSWKVKDIQDMKRGLSKKSPQAFRDIQAGLLRHIADKTKAGQTTLSNGERVVSGAKMLTELNRIGDAKLTAVLGKKSTTELKEIARIIERATNKNGLNASSTETTRRNFDTMIAKPFTNLVNRVPIAGQYVAGIMNNLSKGADEKALKDFVEEAIRPHKALLKEVKKQSNAWSASGASGTVMIPFREK